MSKASDFVIECSFAADSRPLSDTFLFFKTLLMAKMDMEIYKSVQRTITIGTLFDRAEKELPFHEFMHLCNFLLCRMQYNNFTKESRVGYAEFVYNKLGKYYNQLPTMGLSASPPVPSAPLIPSDPPKELVGHQTPAETFDQIEGEK